MIALLFLVGAMAYGTIPTTIVTYPPPPSSPPKPAMPCPPPPAHPVPRPPPLPATRPPPPPAIVAPPPAQGGHDLWLASINAYRLLHSAPPVQWDANLAQLEQAHTDACVFAHSADQYGENLGLGYYSVSNVVDAWYSEVSNYDYANPVFGMKTGHFTQLVWVTTERIGCSHTACPGAIMWGCKFDPPGNYQGQFQANVLP